MKITEQKVAWVTGAGMGIGLACVQFTKDIPARRVGKLQEIADAVLWLCSPQSTYMNGQGLIVDGGLTVR